MAEKKTMSTLAAKAVARLKEQGMSKWGTGEHLAMLRYMTVDAMIEAKVPKELADKVNATLKKAFAEDLELGYASNFQKLLEKCGELKAAGEYE